MTVGEGSRRFSDVQALHMYATEKLRHQMAR